MLLVAMLYYQNVSISANNSLNSHIIFIFYFFFEKKIYFHMRKNQQKTQLIKLCTKGRVEKKQ